jgi:hypothetical protein
VGPGKRRGREETGEEARKEREGGREIGGGRMRKQNCRRHDKNQYERYRCIDDSLQGSPRCGVCTYEHFKYSRLRGIDVILLHHLKRGGGGKGVRKCRSCHCLNGGGKFGEIKGRSAYGSVAICCCMLSAGGVSRRMTLQCKNGASVSVCVSVSLSVSLSVFVSVCVCVCLSVCLSV